MSDCSSVTVYIWPVPDLSEPPTADDDAAWERHERVQPLRTAIGDEFVDMANHPATLAGDVARAHLAKLGERHGWDFWEVDDVTSDD